MPSTYCIEFTREELRALRSILETTPYNPTEAHNAYKKVAAALATDSAPPPPLAELFDKFREDD